MIDKEKLMEKIVDYFWSITYSAIILAIILGSIVFTAIQCVAETRVAIETIKCGKVPVEVSNEK